MLSFSYSKRSWPLNWLPPDLPMNWVRTPPLGISAELPAAPTNTSPKDP
jgi:hypothetical protein